MAKRERRAMDGLAVLNYGLAAAKIGMSEMELALAGGEKGFAGRRQQRCQLAGVKLTHGFVTAAVGMAMLGMPAISARFTRNMAPVLTDMLRKG